MDLRRGPGVGLWFLSRIAFISSTDSPSTVPIKLAGSLITQSHELREPISAIVRPYGLESIILLVPGDYWIQRYRYHIITPRVIPDHSAIWHTDRDIDGHTCCQATETSLFEFLLHALRSEAHCTNSIIKPNLLCSCHAVQG